MRDKVENPVFLSYSLVEMLLYPSKWLNRSKWLHLRNSEIKSFHQIPPLPLHDDLET